VIIEDPRAFEQATIENTPEARDHKGCRVLLVEDVDTNRLLARELLQKFGCTVDTAVNGKEAIQAVESRNYDIVFMDCQMPIMNCFDATRKLREQNDDTVIVALTAHAFAEEIDRCMAVGMNDFISKPINSEILKEVLDKWHRGDRQPQPATPAHIPVAAPEETEAPILDPQFLRDLCEAIPEKAGQIMELAIKDAHKLFGELQTEMDAVNINIKEAGEVAHAMKSAVRQIGGERLARACQRAEKAGKDGDLQELHAAFEQIKGNFDAFIKAVESEASRLTFPPTHT
jgi:CheY-like chemotaxis protein/HPt (histidine-containing phosphotransfer) domain-containing protein